ncbi:TPM domain-containing protein [Lutispora saccharofermentans]|uniref:TPM domain-containing protein n=1 Tax=Lutispora saccharofermentans TaxID=3024236 RepID=A0ABT1NIZ5_9FIRM|nr:TPM domain-containing protein [Lutispora saccharofermentans]MCQ1531242.1 TPM domain-containing protein [Lutispora saccharofermentans]
MVRRAIYRSSAIILIFIFLLAFMSSAFADKSFAVDMAGVFTAEEKESLEQKAIALGRQFSMDIVIVTTSDAEGKSSRDYADDYFDYNGYGTGADRDGILFLIDFDNSEAYISTSGSAIRYLTDERIESILDDVFDKGLSDRRYYDAAFAFLDSAEAFLNKGIPKGQYTVSEPVENTLTTAEVVIGAAVSGVSGLIFLSGTKRRYKSKPKARIFEYKNNSHLNLGITEDNLVNSYVTTRIIPVANKPPRSSSSGRSTVHRSSSGRSHGGGGRKF